jgi:Glyoxalase-like domain
MAAMAHEFQVTVDCADPHTLADWWAQTLGWQVEPQDEAFIRRMISAGYAADSDTKLHRGALVWSEGAAIRHPDGPRRAPRVLFQQVPEPKSVKNRMHLDVRIGTGDLEQAVAALTARGAKFLHNGQQGPHTWATLADPEGNEFCVSRSASPGE